MCEIPTWLLDATDKAELEGFFNDEQKGRGNNFTLELGSSSGFFPFGMDKGDSNNFVCSLLSHDRKGVQLNPYLQHLNTITLVYVSGPSVTYTPPVAEAEGTLSIGTVTTLRPVQTFPETAQNTGIFRTISRGGTVSSVDMGSTADTIESKIDLEMRPGNCAALITYLLATRGGNYTIITPTNTWFFNESSGTFTGKLLSNEIKILHEKFNLFKTQLNFCKV
jgi:hypothetical protein